MSGIIRFGTDGWRGQIADQYTFENVRRCAQGFANYLQTQGYKGEKVIIGYDRRFQSENFAVTAAEVLAGNQFKVMLTQSATPTPAISYTVVHEKAIGAINITASHNPPTDNGFKVRDSNGGAIDPDGLQQIEASIPDIEHVKSDPFQNALENGSIEWIDPIPVYVNQLKKTG
jgi:phosphomannomutase